MSGQDVLTPTRLAGGVWEGVLRAGAEPRLSVTHEGREVAGVGVAADGPGAWAVRVPVPAEAIADGVQTFVISDAVTGAVLGHFAVVAGDALALDLRAEIDLLRAELDLLKRAFRRHCLETGT